jgi:hypothetical protein
MKAMWKSESIEFGSRNAELTSIDEQKIYPEYPVNYFYV